MPVDEDSYVTLHTAHHMARGPSGKLVIEVDPSLKDALHARLAAEKRTMKEWFIDCAKEYLRGQQQLPLLTNAEYQPAPPPLLNVAESASVPAYKTRRSS